MTVVITPAYEHMRDAVLTVSPKKQYLGHLDPTTPVEQGPEWMPEKQSNIYRHSNVY